MLSTCLWDKDKILKIIEILNKTYSINFNEFIVKNILDSKYDVHVNYFEILTAIILSQNTSDRSAIKAFNNLKALLKEITPISIATADDNILKNAIRVAGLANRKSRILKELAFVLQHNPLFFKSLEQMDLDEARRKLLELPGVGLKTADVFLLIVLKKPTFPIDTHINRIVKRLGVASASDKYEDIRMKMIGYLDGDINKLVLLHLLLIIHGRKICIARKPRCSQCSVSKLCCKNL